MRTKGREMIATNQKVFCVQQTRRRAMIVPREHGAWGLLLIPLLTGLVAGSAPEYRIGPLFLFIVAALSLFALRTPVENLLGTGAISARTTGERRIALLAAVCFAVPSVACIGALMWRGRYPGLLLFGAAGACALLVQVVLRKLGRDTRMISQVVGAIGLTCTAPAAYYIGTGHLDTRAFVLWIANWIFAGNQIHFVQLRIQAARAATFAEKFARGQLFLLAQPVLLSALILASLWRFLPPLSIIAFVPAIVRGSLWFIQKNEPLDVKSLGWSEMKQGVTFGVLLALAFIY